jgi:hypothetical protein
MGALPTEVHDELWQHVDKRQAIAVGVSMREPNGLSRLPIEDK